MKVTTSADMHLFPFFILFYVATASSSEEHQDDHTVDYVTNLQGDQADDGSATINLQEAVIEHLMDRLWKDYVGLAPEALKIHQVISENLIKGDHQSKIPNDHVAFRGINAPGWNIDSLSQPFLQLGYHLRDDEYHFSRKKLYARYLDPPTPGLPKVFISELLVEQLSPTAQAIIGRNVAETAIPTRDMSLLFDQHSPFPITSREYKTLAQESEYAAWFLAFGIRPNHFTVSVHELNGNISLEHVIDLVEQVGFALNSSGGVIKGSVEQGLRQSSTIARDVKHTFQDGTALEIPGVYYEFAQRHVLKDKLYGGFIAASADKIFESIDSTKAKIE